MPRILCAWFPQWPLQRQQRRDALARADRNPSPSQGEPGPLILYEDGRHGRRVRHGCPRAESLGIRSGMPVAEAQAIAGAVEIRFLPVDPGRDLLELRALAEWCQQFAPRISLEETERPESLFLDVTGCGAYFGSEEDLAARVQRGFVERGYNVRLALADTPGAAWALARTRRARGVGQAETPEIQIAPQEGDTPRSLLEMLAPLPVSGLRLPAETLATLQELGIECIGQLARLPRASLPARLGPEILLRLDQALGNRVEILVPHQPLPPVEAGRTFEDPLAHRLAVECILESLLRELVSPLETRGQGITQLSCRMECGTSFQEFPVGVYRPTLSVRHLHELFRMQLERRTLAGPVTSIQLRVRSTAPLPVRQVAWWNADDPAIHRERELASLLDRLTSRLSPSAVLRPGITGEAQPEFRFQYKPWITSPDGCGSSTFLGKLSGDFTQKRLQRLRKRNLPSKSGGSLLPPLRIRPQRMFTPERVPVTSLVPDGPPLRFRWQNADHVVARTWGPERLETGWWRDDPVARDYYRIETCTGLHAWLFRRQPDGQWFLQGWYE